MHDILQWYIVLIWVIRCIHEIKHFIFKQLVSNTTKNIGFRLKVHPHWHKQSKCNQNTPSITSYHLHKNYRHQFNAIYQDKYKKYDANRKKIIFFIWILFPDSDKFQWKAFFSQLQHVFSMMYFLLICSFVDLKINWMSDLHFFFKLDILCFYLLQVTLDSHIKLPYISLSWFKMIFKGIKNI